MREMIVFAYPVENLLNPPAVTDTVDKAKKKSEWEK